MAEYRLEMRGVSKSFPGVKALDQVNLKVRPGTVHALMGENGAGKSTLMKCLFGIYHMDEGEIYLDGEKVSIANPDEALQKGLAMVHQELQPIPERTVAENMYTGRYPMKRFGPIKVIDHKKMFEETAKWLEDVKMPYNPKAKLGTMSIAQMQSVEIAKAVSYDAKILVLDEPTSSLTKEEVGHLFRIINRLRDRGVGMVYISHKMEEILEISDDVTIMRDGKWIATKSAKDITMDEIIKLMVGRDLTERFPEKTNKPGEVLMKVEGLTGKYMPSCIDASFELRKGEVLGVAGLVGSRRTELLETIFGIAHRESGKIELHGKEIYNKDSRQAIKNGFALLTEERRATGIIPLQSITFNAVLANMKSYLKCGLLSTKKMEKDAKWVIDSMHVKTPSSKTHIKSLSGGNQQKVIIGRWLLTEPEVLLLDEPTRGIDVGAKFEIYQLINDLAAKGKGVMVVSSEMPELIGICDRILVMSNGRVAGILDMKKDYHGQEQEEIMRLAAKYI